MGTGNLQVFGREAGAAIGVCKDTPHPDLAPPRGEEGGWRLFSESHSFFQKDGGVELLGCGLRRLGNFARPDAAARGGGDAEQRNEQHPRTTFPGRPPNGWPFSAIGTCWLHKAT